MVSVLAVEELVSVVSVVAVLSVVTVVPVVSTGGGGDELINRAYGDRARNLPQEL